MPVLARPLSAAAAADRSLVVRAAVARERADAGVTRGSVADALDRGLAALFGQSPDRVWRALFKPGDIVGLKLNCLAGRGLSTHKPLVEAVIARLKSAGIAPADIVVWDRLADDLRRAGFRPVNLPGQVRYLGNDQAGYSSRLFEAGSVCSRLSRLVSEECTALINLPVLKDHGIVGMSGAMKNYFGAIDNPNKYHSSAGDPFVADLCRLPEIRSKTRLTICDAITAQYEGGPPFMPQWCWPLGELLLATDMVALDRIGWQILEEKRALSRLPSLLEAGREPRYIHTAGRLGLGQAEIDQIQVVPV